MTTPVKEVFKAEDFNQVKVIYAQCVSGMLGSEVMGEVVANMANKILNERLVKYHGVKDESGYFCVTKERQSTDYLIILGFEPEPIVRDEKKVAVTRADIKRAWDQTRFCFKEDFVDIVCKELGL